jgi:hypothetical protein
MDEKKHADKKGLTLGERWKIDAALAENSTAIKSGTCQCRTCIYWNEKDTRHCEPFAEKDKPAEILFNETICPYLREKDG